MTFPLLTQQTDLQSVTPGEFVLREQSVCLPQRDEPAAVFFVASLSEIEKSVLCICGAWMCYLVVFSFFCFSSPPPTFHYFILTIGKVCVWFF